MEYGDALVKMKELIKDRLTLLIADEAFKNTPDLNKEDYVENMYTIIMALGYNFGDIEKATADIFEMKAALLGLDESHITQIKQGVIDVLGQFKTEVDVFSIFHFNTQQEMSNEDAVAVAERTFNDDFTPEIEE